MARRFQLQLPNIRSAALVFTVAMIIVSVLAAVIPALAALLTLVPRAVTHGFFVWQILTYAFVETSPMGVIFGAIILYSIGGSLEATWGRKRFIGFALGTTALAAVATVLLSLVWTRLDGSIFAGAAVMSSAVWVAYGLAYGDRQMNFWGMPVSGNIFALMGAGFVLLNAAFARSVSVVLPHLFALLFTWLYMRGGVSPSNWWMRFRGWQLERDLKRRSSHLKSVDGGKRNVSGGSDKFLH